jgi:hypothetical protein
VSALLPPLLADALSDPERRRRAAGWLVALACVVWMGASGWMFFGEVPANMFENHSAPVVQERMRNCEGNFHQRFNCKQAILLNGERWGFAVMLDRLLLMMAPPVTAWIVWSALRGNSRRS